MFVEGEYFTSRSNIVDWLDCRRLGFLSEDFNGQGYAPVASRVPLLSGDHIHNALAQTLGHYSGISPIDGNDPIATVVERITSDYTAEILETGIQDLNDAEVEFTRTEQLVLLEGMLRGWVTYRLPIILDEFDVVEIEHTQLWKLGPGINIPIKRDALLRRKLDGLLGVMDFKGAPFVDDAWQRTHEQSLQTILYLEATEELLGEATFGIFYEGLVRGYWRKDTAESSPFFGRRIQQSPYCYGYANYDGFEPLRQAKYTNRKGFVKFRVADELPVAEWLQLLEKEDILPGLFVTMAPVNPTPEFRGRVRQQLLFQMQRRLSDLNKFNALLAKHGLDHPLVQAQLDLMAPMNTARCYKYGADYRCPFVHACPAPGGGLAEIPESPEFEVRKPHHDLKGIIKLQSIAA